VDRAAWMPKRAVEYVPWRRMDAERPAHREGIPDVVSRDEMEEVYEGGHTVTGGQAGHGAQHGVARLEDLHAAAADVSAQQL